MTKKKNNLKDNPAAKSKQASVAASAFTRDPNIPGWLYNFNIQVLILSIIVIVFYWNTFSNQYALDDETVIVKNEYVQEGFAGLPGIFFKDSYDSYYRQSNATNQLSGGRYRPLSIATFAVEQQFLGAVPEEGVDSVLGKPLNYDVSGTKLAHDMHVRHVVNVILYLLLVITLLYFFRSIVFKNNPAMAFIAALIFAIHPIHTEVVANVKSRDEIMSLFFICLTFIFDFKYREHKKVWFLAGAMLSFFLAFLSKEYAISLVVLLPLSWYIFNKYPLKKSILSFVPYLAVLFIYAVVRLHAVGPKSATADNELLNNPYLFATPAQKLATEISTMLNYLRLLLFPHPLSSDYSYNAIPYKDFSSLQVWLSLIVHVGLIVAFFKLLKQRSVLSFAIAFYLVHLLLVCNLLFDIGGTMGERFIFHSSVGFAIAAAYLLYKGAEKIKPIILGQRSLAALLLIIVVLCGFKIVERNADWKNNSTLYMADIQTVPTSVLVNGNLASAYIEIADAQKNDSVKKEYLHKSIALLDYAISMHPVFMMGYKNRGVAYYKLGEVDKTKSNFDSIKKYNPVFPTLDDMYKDLVNYYINNGWNSYGKYGKYPEAINEYKKGLAIDSVNPSLWYNMGAIYFSDKQYSAAIDAFQKAINFSPGKQNALAQNGIVAVMGASGGGKK